MSNRRVFYYKGVRVNAFGMPILARDRKVSKDKRVRSFYNLSFEKEFKDNAPKNLIVMYDIPSEKKKERDWFRRHLVKFGYSMIQKSVWVGPSPLPREFIEYVKSIGLGRNLKTFKLASNYTGKEKVF